VGELLTSSIDSSTRSLRSLGRNDRGEALSLHSLGWNDNGGQSDGNTHQSVISTEGPKGPSGEIYGVRSQPASAEFHRFLHSFATLTRSE